MAKKKLENLEKRDHAVFSNLTSDDWKKFAGKILAINPENDEILAVGESEEQLEADCHFTCKVVEFFHVPPAGSLGQIKQSAK